MRRILALAAAAATMVFGTPAWADETWTSPQVGRIVWADDVGDTSIFTYQVGTSTVKMYIEGLPGNIENRRVMAGYWIIPGQDDPSSGACSAALTGIDGETSHTWGRLEIRWARRTFPTAFTARMVDCFAGATTTLRAQPNVGF